MRRKKRPWEVELYEGDIEIPQKILAEVEAAITDLDSTPFWLRKESKKAVGLAVRLVSETLARGRTLVEGVSPRVALGHALSPAMVKVAGLDEPPPPAPASIINLLVAQPGQGALGANLAPTVLKLGSGGTTEGSRLPEGAEPAPEPAPGVDLLELVREADRGEERQG